VLACLCACAKDQPGPRPGDRACTAMGCLDGLRLEFVKTGPWLPGRYAFKFDLDGAAVTCTGALPLKPCDAGPSLTCDVPGKLQIGESGCALPPGQHGFSDVQISGTPRVVRLDLAHDDAPMIHADMTPTYRTVRPNGEGCEPVCNGATERVPLP
jgi:hypothetical protein